MLSVFGNDTDEIVRRAVEEWELADADKLVVNDERESIDDALVVVLSESGTTETLLDKEFADVEGVGGRVNVRIVRVKAHGQVLCILQKSKDRLRRHSSSFDW